MPQPKYASFGEYFKDIVLNTVNECVVCGECVRGCTTYPLTSLKDENPEYIMQKMIDFLKGGEFSEEVYIKAFSCSGCGDCSDLCPQKIDPLLTHEAIKIDLTRQGKNPLMKSDDIFTSKNINPDEILSCLQTKPSDEVRWLKKIPSQPEKTENLIFLGCGPPAVFPNRVNAFLDILESIGADFVALAGGEVCCGGRFCPSIGMVREAEESARSLVSVINAFTPERVILFCPGCHRQFTEYYHNFLDMDFRFQFHIEYLVENMEKIKFVEPLEKTVAFYNSCTIRRAQCTEMAKKLLMAVPGLKLVEMEQITEQNLCCGGMANLTCPQIGKSLRDIIVNATKETGADYLVSECAGCHISLYSHIQQCSFGLQDISTIINKSIGGRDYEEKLGRYWRSKNIEEIIEQSRECFEANGFTEEEMRKILPHIFFPN